MLNGSLFILLLFAGTAGRFYILIKTKDIDLNIENSIFVTPDDTADEFPDQPPKQ